MDFGGGTLYTNRMTEIAPSSKTIFVVDDDETVLSFLAFSLESEGFKVLKAKDAEQGLKILQTNKPDLMLLDIMLPNMDGFAMCKTIRQDARLAQVPVLFITAYGDPTSLDKTKDAGAQGLIEKPIMFSELLVQVLDALQGRFSLPTRLKYSR